MHCIHLIEARLPDESLDQKPSPAYDVVLIAVQNQKSVQTEHYVPSICVEVNNNVPGVNSKFSQSSSYSRLKSEKRV